MGRLLTILAENWPADTAIGRLCDGWPGDLGPNAASLPLRLAGGLHSIVLGAGDPALAGAYPPNTVPDTDLRDAVLGAMERHADFLVDWMQSPPQTNEVRRAGIIIPAAHWIAARTALPMRISELGASAGLNLMWDRFALELPGTRLGPARPALTLKPDWRGQMPEPADIEVIERGGVDLNPINTSDPAQVQRLLAYLWPDQPYRAEMTRAAVDAQNAPVENGDAINWLAGRLECQPTGCLHLIYHTIAWQYFPEEAQRTGCTLIETAGAGASDDRPLAWLSFENDGDPEGLGGAAITVRLWPGNQRFALGRADFHGRWVDWAPREIT